MAVRGGVTVVTLLARSDSCNVSFAITSLPPVAAGALFQLSGGAPGAAIVSAGTAVQDAEHRVAFVAGEGFDAAAALGEVAFEYNASCGAEWAEGRVRLQRWFMPAMANMSFKMEETEVKVIQLSEVDAFGNVLKAVIKVALRVLVGC